MNSYIRKMDPMETREELGLRYEELNCPTCGNTNQEKMSFVHSKQKIHVMVYCQVCHEYIGNAKKALQWKIKEKKQERLF
jgi:transcription elongation factor Elf1